MPNRIRVVLADGDAVLRGSLQALLAPHDDVVVAGQAGTADEAAEVARRLRPDVVVLDVAMPGMAAADATCRIAELVLHTHVLVLTAEPEEECLIPVLEAGASGFVRKASAEDLPQAIRTVAAGEVFLYPSATRALLSRYQQAREPQDPGLLARLSDREREVLTLTAAGYSSAEVGKKLFLSPKTVDTYRARMMQKLGLSHRADLVRLALESGMLRSA
ncbi:MAG TPA: response regulator transcription factor [Longimicrobium sp.]|jgi:two-component system response regulator NreC|uniref:response regulator transcription factor n=1 Tax=Longimicrobium sp. TaxID=2029185 RepID=UPI002ED849CE